MEVQKQQAQAKRKQNYFLEALYDAEDPSGVAKATQPARDEEEEEEEEEEKEAAAGAPGPLPTSGQAGVNLATRLSELRNQNQVGRTAARQAAGRNCVKIRGTWIDDGFDGNTKTVAVKAMSAAYFRILERQPQMREVFRLGNRVVWVTPCGTALVIAPNSGAETLTDAEIDALFVAKP
jgi:Ca-activated chloride channel family protein